MTSPPKVSGDASSAGTGEPAGAEAVARRVFDAIDRHDLDGIAACLHPDDIQDFVPVGVRHGPTAVRALFAELLAAVPDLRMTVEDVVVAGDRAWVRWRVRGTFLGDPFQGIRATGRHIDLRGCDAWIEVRDGLIHRNTIVYDGAGFLRQAGLLPERGSAAEGLLLAVFNGWTRLRTLARALVPHRRR